MTMGAKVPQAFFMRRMHSLMGVWLVLFLIEHLLTNSQAALWIEDDGSGFVRGVNLIQSLPYLHAIELLLLGIPFFIHIVWGIQYLRTGQFNSFPGDGTKPILTEYPRNHAYTWQRITSWILVFAVIAHVSEMRFIKDPESAKIGDQEHFMVKVSLDDGLETVAERLGVSLYGEGNIQDVTFGGTAVSEQKKEQQKHFSEILASYPLKEGEVIAVAKNFGTAELLVVRDTFKSPIMRVLYTLFVLAATYHAFNGLWTSMVTWGITLTERSQQMMKRGTIIMMLLLSFLGLAAIWGTYLITLKY